MRALAHVLARKAAAAKLTFTQDFAGFDDAGHLNCARLDRTIRSLARRGATSAELCVHPGLGAGDTGGRLAWGYRWADELRAICAPATHDAVNTSGLQLGTYATLAASRAAAALQQLD